MSVPARSEGPIRTVSVPRCTEWPWHPYAECPACGDVICYGHAAVRDEWIDGHGNRWSANLRHADCNAPEYGQPFVILDD